MRILARSAAFIGLLAAAFVPLGAIAPAASAEEAPSAATRFGTATFEAGRSAIVVPYTGAAPTPTLYTISGSHHYYDMGGSRLERPAVQFKRVGGAIERFTMANRPASTVRLSFKLTQPATPTVQVDAARKQLVIWPLGKAVRAVAAPAATPKPKATPKPVAKPAAKPTPKPAAKPVARRPAPKATAAPQARTPGRDVRVPTGLTPPTPKYALKTEVGKPYFDDFHHRLVLPYKGQEPDFTVVVYYKNPRWVYFDFSNAYITAEGERFETFVEDAAFEGWMLSQRKGGLKTRLYLKLKQPGQVVAQVHAESNQIWLEMPKGPRKGPEGSEPLRVPLPGRAPAQQAPAAPAPSADPTPEDEPEADAPAQE